MTVPYSLSLYEQIQLARELENIGVQILQTEGLKLQARMDNSCCTELVNRSFPVLSSTYAISKAVKIPVVAASGMNIVTASLAILYGASGIGMGSSILNHSGILSRSTYLKTVMKSLQSISKVSHSNKVDFVQCYNNSLI